MHHKKKKQKGFTLIEVLVVVAIIGMLSTIVAVSMSQVRMAGRDLKRFQDMKTLSKAIDLYNLETESYPLNEGNIAISQTVPWPNWYSWESLGLPLQSYISSMPRPPKMTEVSPGQWAYVYQRLPPGSWTYGAGCVVIGSGGGYLLGHVFEGQSRDYQSNIWTNGYGTYYYFGGDFTFEDFSSPWTCT